MTARHERQLETHNGEADFEQVFIWRVPEGFTLYTDEEEPRDVAPVRKLVGHSR
jgi:coronin-1B/1C/6